MTPNDKPEFLRIMNGLASVFGSTLTPEALDLWWATFADWTVQEFRAAASAVVKRTAFMPRPADFMAIRRATLPTKGEAWAAVLRHLKGGYRTGGLSPEVDRAVAALGGYRTLAMLPTDQLPWQEKRFAEHYGEAREADETRPALTGPDWLQLQSEAPLKRLA